MDYVRVIVQIVHLKAEPVHKSANSLRAVALQKTHSAVCRSAIRKGGSEEWIKLHRIELHKYTPAVSFLSQNQEDEMGGSCDTYTEKESAYRVFVGTTR